MRKETTYGQRGGVGPTRGKKATAYLVTLPGGFTVKKYSYHVHQPLAFVQIFNHGNGWRVGGLWATAEEIQQINPNAVIVEAKAR